MLGHNITKSLIKLFSMIILIFIVDIGYLDYVYVVILGNILHRLDVCTRRCHLAVSTANLYNLGFPLPVSSTVISLLINGKGVILLLIKVEVMMLLLINIIISLVNSESMILLLVELVVID
jgi:hypothetical protein